MTANTPYGLGRFIIQKRIPARHTIQLIGASCSPNIVCQRCPLKNMGVNIKRLITYARENMLSLPSGIENRALNLCSPVGSTFTTCRKFLPCQRVVPLDGNAYGTEQGGQGKHQ